MIIMVWFVCLQTVYVVNGINIVNAKLCKHWKWQGWLWKDPVELYAETHPFVLHSLKGTRTKRNDYRSMCYINNYATVFQYASILIRYYYLKKVIPSTFCCLMVQWIHMKISLWCWHVMYLQVTYAPCGGPLWHLQSCSQDQQHTGVHFPRLYPPFFFSGPDVQGLVKQL